jgi:hypothetical protein
MVPIMRAGGELLVNGEERLSLLSELRWAGQGHKHHHSKPIASAHSA